MRGVKGDPAPRARFATIDRANETRLLFSTSKYPRARCALGWGLSPGRVRTLLGSVAPTYTALATSDTSSIHMGLEHRGSKREEGA